MRFKFESWHKLLHSAGCRSDNSLQHADVLMYIPFSSVPDDSADVVVAQLAA